MRRALPSFAGGTRYDGEAPGKGRRQLRQVNVNPGRNDPCPCGSGKKFERCCGLEQPQAAAQEPDGSDLAALVRSGRFADLEVRARQLIAREPASGLAWKALSVSLRARGMDALDALERAATHSPLDAEAHANLGNALLEIGRLSNAVASYRRALHIDPENADAHSNLGNALRGLGQTAEAVASYRRALQIKPRFAVAHNNLANALRALGQLDEAVANYHQALDIDPSYAEACNNLGNALLDLGRLPDALESYRRAVELKPDFAQAHSNLGNALRAMGRLDDAVSSYRRAIALSPDFAGAHSNLSDALRDLGHSELAAQSSRQAVAIDPKFAGAHNSLGNSLLDLGRLEDAAASYERALAINPRFTQAHINVGMVRRLQGRTAEAESSCRAALKIDANAAAAMVVLAEACTDGGRFAAAEDLLRRAVEADPDLPEAWAGIAQLRKMTPADAPWLAQVQRVAARRLAPRQEVYLRYALGKYFDDVRDFDAAFANYRRANELTKLYASPHDRQQVTAAADRLIRVYDGREADRPSIGGLDSTRPVFIIGMPRSGTTLAEQILASHPAVFGAGELAFWSNASAAHGPLRLDDGAGAPLIAHLGNEYLRLLGAMSAEALHVVDKMPANFLSLGLIHEVFPRARIIHIRRNPLDTCLSIYFQHFKSGHSYANDLGDLAHYYQEYSRLMQHWRRVMPAAGLLEVPYEGLVDDQEHWSRQMLAFIGLPWDIRCLDFHRTHRSVITASKWQVRQKMSRSSIDRWRNYQQFLGPLRNLKET
jgi:tetratricopeptide (TPR) repeat protein